MRRWVYTGLAAIALAEAAAPSFVYSDPPHFWFEDLPAWSSIYGFVSCVLIIEVSKFLGKHWLMRSENHYDC